MRASLLTLIRQSHSIKKLKKAVTAIFHKLFFMLNPLKARNPKKKMFFRTNNFDH